MASTRTPPSKLDLLEALAASLEAGVTPSETLALIARAGPESARMARRISEAMRGGTLTAALVSVGLLGRDEQAPVALGEEGGRLASALRWAVERDRFRRERRRAIRRAAIGPLLFAALGLLAEPLPASVLGSANWGSAIRGVLLLGAAAALVFVGLPPLLAKWTRRPRGWTLLGRVPGVGALVRLDGEAEAAALIAAFADDNGLGLAPSAVRAAGVPAHVEALGVLAADPLTAVPTFSEPFALALQVGLRAGDLPARLAAFHRAAATTLTSRLQSLIRVLAFTVLAFVALNSLLKMVQSPLPGLGGDLSNVPELKDLMRELENAGH